MFLLPEKIDLIYAALAGATATLTAAYVTGRQALKRQKLDLEHTAAERAREREHSAQQNEIERIQALRREVYLPFVDAMGAAVAFVPKMANCPIENLTTMEPLMEQARHFARLSFVAGREVIEPVANSTLYLQACSQILIQKRFLIEDIGNQIFSKDLLIQRLQERQKVLGELIVALRDRNDESEQFKRLNFEFIALSDLIQTDIKEGEALSQKKTEMEFQLQREATELIFPIRQHTVEAVIAIRREMGLQLDEEWYRQFSEEAANAAAESVAKFQSEIRNQMLGSP